jgi:hypothetical protein
MTTQKAYETIRKYFTQPGAELAMVPVDDRDTASNCVYRKVIHGRVRKCAIGCMIPKRLYDPAMEQQSVGQLFEHFSEVESLFADVDFDFLFRVQDLHDTSEAIEGFITDLDDLAMDFKLQVPTNA